MVGGFVPLPIFNKMATQFCSVTEVQDWLRISNPEISVNQQILNDLVDRVSDFMLSLLNDPNFFSASYIERRNGNAGTQIVPLHNPVTAVSLVQVGTLVVPASTDVTVPGYIFDKYSIQLTGGYLFCKGIGNITLQYTGGYDPNNFPQDLRQCAIEICAQKYRRRTHIDTEIQNAPGGGNVTFSKVDIPREARTVIESYKKRGFIV